jgi:hypothetical protein
MEKTANGESRMANREWRMEKDGESRIANGEWWMVKDGE